MLSSNFTKIYTSKDVIFNESEFFGDSSDAAVFEEQSQPLIDSFPHISRPFNEQECDEPEKVLPTRMITQVYSHKQSFSGSAC